MIKRWLTQARPPLFVAYCIAAAFCTYFCMYAFRKPFGAATFEGLKFLDTEINLKTAFVISQIIGYTISKYMGCKFCSEIGRAYQAKALVAMIIIAELALLGFAVLPENLKVAAIFINGVPLGMVWGLVSRYLEGRKTAELLFAGLSCSYILASSSVKTVGGWTMESGVTQFWMPATVGAIFLVPFFLSVFFLNQLPPPSEEDITSRSERTIMDGKGRAGFIRQFLVGMILLLVLYFFLTAYRDFRDNYMPEVFTAMGYASEPTLFSRADYPIAFGIMVVMALLNLAKNHRRGLLAVFAVMISGMFLMGIATLLKDMDKISGMWWMILIGFGAYLAYVPFGAVLFERVMASTKAAGTAVFAIYLCDAVGYTGSVGIQIYKDLGHPDLDYYQFLRMFTYAMAGAGTVLFLLSSVYFYRKAGAAISSQER
ncbi:MAG: DUF5690 family protein [Verrucomicrobiales bacterium]